MTADANLTDAAAAFERATAAMRGGRWEEALAGYDAVLRLHPGHVPSLNNRGIVLSRLGRHAEALASIDEALLANPSDPIALNNRGEELQKLMRPDESLASYDAAIRHAPGFPEAHANRSHLLGQLGRTREAVEALRGAIALEPGQPRFYLHLAPLHRFTADDPLLEQMRRLAAGPEALSVDGRIELGFALGKALADIGEHERAFDAIEAANRLKRSTFHYDERELLAELERTGELYGQAFLARTAGAGDPGPEPILIVGLPRSGSTLLEQILAGDPEVFAAGENTHFDDALAETLAHQGLEASLESATLLSPEAIRDLGAAYLKRLGAAAPAGARLVDKTLSNFRHLGLLHSALPGARVIHARRDPVDACMSCYGLLFGGAQPYAYDLAELGRYARACEALMARWRECLPAETLLEIRYEALIADPETQVRRLLGHCGLDWDPRRLDFHTTDRQVRTSSASQVRRPLYATSVGASRIHGPRLAPLLDALGIDRAEAGAGDMLGNGDQAGWGPQQMAVEALEQKAGAGDVAAQRALADRLDAAGRHDEAVEWLARAGAAGDALALTRLGVRLVTGLNAPFLPADGARLLDNAAGAGGVEAMERLAVLIGGGFYARQSWDAALDLLQKAAEGGSANAQTQLRLLAGKAGSVDGWSDLRRSVDVASWTRAPEPRVLSPSPRILAVSGLVPPELCDWIVGQAGGKLVRAELYDPNTGQPMPGTETRLNRIANFNLAETHLANLFVQARMAAVVGAPLQMLEAFAVLNYAPNEEYGEHVDYLDPAIPAYAAELAQRGQRVATGLLYLNDDYEGGETAFPKLGISFKGGKGDALVFFNADGAGRPDPRTVHAGRTPTSGQKWLLSQFFRNRPAVGQGPRLA